MFMKIHYKKKDGDYKIIFYKINLFKLNKIFETPEDACIYYNKFNQQV
jgi:hypothetical protein